MSKNRIQDYLPQPLLDDIVKRNVIPLVGAGFSRNAEGLPTGKKMPLWTELGENFADLMHLPYCNDPIESISAFVKSHKKIRLVEYLTEMLFVNTARAGDAHKFLVKLPFDVILTTNFDTLIEQAHDREEISYNVISDISDISRSIPNERKIVKLHGDLRHAETIIITDDDFRLARSEGYKLKNNIIHWLTTRTLLIIGYSVTDPDFIQFLKITDNLLGQTRRPSYILLFDANEEEITRLANLGITSISNEGKKENYGNQVSSILKELVDYVKLPQKSDKLSDSIDDLSQLISLISLDAALVSSSVKKPIFCKSLFEFIKQAITTMSSIIVLLRKAAKTQQDKYSMINFPSELQIEHQFMLSDTVEYLIEGNESALEKLPSYEDCIKIIDGDLLISQQVNKHYIIFSLIELLTHWKYISHILIKVIFRFILTGNFDEKHFMNLYSDLEHFFINNELDMFEISPLYNITLIGTDSIELSSNLCIRKISDREKILLHKSNLNTESNVYRLQNVKYVIEYKFKIPKGFEREQEYRNYPSNISSIFSSLVAALRLFQTKPVGIYYLCKILELDIPLFAYAIDLYALNLGISMGDYYILEKEQVLQFQQFWKKYSKVLIDDVLDYKRYDNDKLINVKNSMQYFLWGFSIKDGSEMYAEFMKSLLTLLFLDTEESVPFRATFIRRAANLLTENQDEDQEIQVEVTNLYDTYEKIISGNYDYEINIVKIRDYTAKCLVKYLDAMNENSFSHQKFIESIDN
jgi:SIR2-like domain